MINISKHKGGLLVVALCVVAIMGVYFNQRNQDPKITRVDQSFITDFNNSRRLVGFSDNVFVGQVIAQTDKQSEDGIPVVMFNVKVLENIKGSLKNNVTVLQEGDSTVRVDGDTPLIPGNTYMFSCTKAQGKKSASQNMYTFIPYFGDVLINKDVDRQNLTAKFKHAHDTEIPSNARDGGITPASVDEQIYPYGQQESSNK